MNLRLVQFNLGPGQRAAAETIADKVIPAIRAQAGCARSEFFIDEASGDCGLIVLWDSRQAADAASMVIGPLLSSLLIAAQADGDSRRLYEVYEPKAG